MIESCSSPSGVHRPPNVGGGESLAVVGAPTLQSTRRNTNKKTLSHTHTHDEPLRPYPERLCPLSPWVGQLCQQNMAPPLPIAMRRRRAIGVALAVVGLLVWGGLVTNIEIERGGGRHGLKWPLFYQNKQQSNGGRLRRVCVLTWAPGREGRFQY